jgi:hypothetical protein
MRPTDRHDARTSRPVRRAPHPLDALVAWSMTISSALSPKAGATTRRRWSGTAKPWPSRRSPATVSAWPLRST